jgi:hypothetical protein
MSQHSLVHLAWIVPLAVLAIYIGSPRFLGTMGSERVKKLLNASLPKSRYTLIHDLTLPSGRGDVHFDHIIVSRYGIYVIDTIYRRGWISGSEVQERWIQKLKGKSRKFENPLHANFLRVQVLESLLELHLSNFHPLVVFSGHTGFKNEEPGKVIAVEQMLLTIKKKNRDLLTPEQVGQLVMRLKSSALQSHVISRVRRWKLVRLILVLALMTSVYYVYREQINVGLTELQYLTGRKIAPEKYHPDGSLKTELELQQERLICSYSVDTDRCACYEPGGEKVSLDTQNCRRLAEKGSILKQ